MGFINFELIKKADVSVPVYDLDFSSDPNAVEYIIDVFIVNKKDKDSKGAIQVRYRGAPDYNLIKDRLSKKLEEWYPANHYPRNLFYADSVITKGPSPIPSKRWEH